MSRQFPMAQRTAMSTRMKRPRIHILTIMITTTTTIMFMNSDAFFCVDRRD
jgi:hypothetical protein